MQYSTKLTSQYRISITLEPNSKNAFFFWKVQHTRWFTLLSLWFVVIVIAVAVIVIVVVDIITHTGSISVARAKI